MKCQQSDVILLQDIVTNVAPRIVRGTTSGHNYGPGQVIFKESSSCVFITGDPNLQCLWYYFHIFNLDKKYNLKSIWWTFKLSHSSGSLLEAKNMFWFWLSRAHSSILSSSVKRLLLIGSRSVLKYILIFWTFSELILFFVAFYNTLDILSGGEGAQSGFPRKSSDREYHVQVLSSSSSSCIIMCMFYISSRHHHSCKLRDPYLSI